VIIRKLDNIKDQIFWQKLVNDLNNYLKNKDLSNKILTINLKEIAYDSTSHIPKIEYKESQVPCIT
jgi:hypothetical protein